ncbi:glycerol-3-phosphate dehydrogenase [Kaistia algarum]|uniref:glycerol-3-phosphate dehydrogenase/oxidase n=1 Tax=Kaistia algarum TaxID=2083279 RepID=UPI000CE78392|nr:glycerol-3-phosphate dehydrogenase/oxidase [Kaistia algarum]MCX5515372.1 glycerol-3-phosphate dehydrogenase/oxidase [Kaistia algarum]PPE77831.1 glycerol-3-phosphate dehydrogenase [Kaistia algarum]
MSHPAPPVPESVDVLVIGGGINGISTFRELALQGVDVALMERDDFCSGASAALSRMVHGGLRYMENGEFRLVHQSLLERDRLLRNAPHCVSPLPTLIPINVWFKGMSATLAAFFGRGGGPRRRPGVMVRLGLTLYDLLSWRSRTMPRHRGLGRREARRMAPGLTGDAIGAVLYYDARVTMPERLGVEMVLDTEAQTEARTFSYTEIVGGNRDGLVWRDRLTGASGRIAAKVVVNATGAWVDHVDGAIRQAENRRRVQGTKGSHLMIRNEALRAALGDHMIYYENSDGRICIAFNHAGASMVGSTDIRVDDPDDAVCLAEERDYMLGALAGVFPKLEIVDDEIVHVFTGVRPLPVSGDGPTGRISRDHSVEVEPSGPLPYALLTLIGGKWTTFRAFGEEVADLALKQLGRHRTLSTQDMPIGGGRDLPLKPQARDRWVREQAEVAGLSETEFGRLARRYGSRATQVARFIGEGPDAPLHHAGDHSRRELLFLILHERVREIGDLLLRRTALGIEGRISPSLVEEVAGIMADPLGWSEAERAGAVGRFETIMSRRHRVQGDDR